MNSRLQKIRESWPDARLKSLAGVEPNANPDDIFRLVVDADPTPNHKYVDWTLKSWENHGLLFEDIANGADSKTAETLADFERLKSRIGNPKYENEISGIPIRKTSERSLLKYKTPGDLYRAVKPWLIEEAEYGETHGSREQKRLDMMKARLESYHEETPSGIKMDIPSTIFAARKLGQETKWCTSAQEDNMFLKYAKTGPLMIITLPTGERFQAHIDIETEKDDDDYETDYDTEHSNTPSDMRSAIEHYIGEKIESQSSMPDMDDSFEASEESDDVTGLECLQLMVNDMSFMNEADASPTHEDGILLGPYAHDIAEMMAITIIKASHPLLENTRYNDILLNNIAPELTEMLERKINSYQTDIQYNRRPLPVQPSVEMGAPSTNEVPPPQGVIMAKMREEGALTTIDDGREILNIKNTESIQDYIKRYRHIMDDYSNVTVNGIFLDRVMATPISLDSKKKAMTDFFKEILETIDIHGTDIQKFSRDVVHGKRVSPFLESINNSDEYMKAAIIGLILKQKMQNIRTITDGNYKHRGFLENTYKESRLLYNCNLLFANAPLSFVNDFLSKEFSDIGKYREAIIKRLETENEVSKNAMPRYLFDIETSRTNEFFSEADDKSQERLRSLKKVFLVEKMSSILNQTLKYYNYTLGRQSVQNVIDLYRERMQECIPDMNREEIDRSLQGIFANITGGPNQEYISNKVFRDLYNLFNPPLKSEAMIARIVADLDNGHLSKNGRNDLMTVISLHGRMPELGYERFPERYKEAICLLSHIEYDTGHYHDTIKVRSTERYSIPETHYLGNITQDIAIQQIMTCSATVSNPSRSFLERITCLRDELAGKPELTCEQHKALLMARLDAYKMEETENAHTRRAIHAAMDAGLIDDKELSVIDKEKPYLTGFISHIESQIEALDAKMKTHHHQKCDAQPQV